MKNITFNNNNYELITNYKEGFIYDEITTKFTDYFDRFDYICGDWAYGKLRLKGFLDENSGGVKNYNNYKYIDNYLKNNCASDARYFIIKKISWYTCFFVVVCI